MKTIKSVGVFAAAKTFAAIYGCVAVVFVPAEMLAGGAWFRIPGQFEPGTAFWGKVAWHGGRGATWVVWAGIDVLGYVIAGFITGLIAAWFYNFIARRFGGLEVELDD